MQINSRYQISKGQSESAASILAVAGTQNVLIDCRLSSTFQGGGEHSLQCRLSSQVILMGDFNVNRVDEVEQRSLYNIMINENCLKQLIPSCTTDNGTLIDHLYTNLSEDV